MSIFIYFLAFPDLYTLLEQRSVSNEGMVLPGFATGGKIPGLFQFLQILNEVQVYLLSQQVGVKYIGSDCHYRRLKFQVDKVRAGETGVQQPDDQILRDSDALDVEIVFQ